MSDFKLHLLKQSSLQNPEKHSNKYTDSRMNQVNPYVRFACYGYLEPHHTCGPRIIYDYEIIFLKSGRAAVTINGVRHYVQPGDLVFLRPGVEHTFETFDEPIIQPHIHFDLIWEPDSPSVPISFLQYQKMMPEERTHIRQDRTDSFFSDFPDCFRFSNPLLAEQLLYEVIYSYNDPSIFNELKLKQKFLTFFNFLISEIYWDRNTNNNASRMKKEELALLTRMYLEDNLRSQVTMENLAFYLHFDKSYISRCFRQVYDVSPIHYHLVKRIQYAKGMILYTNHSLTSIAEQCAFSSLQDFSRAFHRIEGISPSDLRKSSSHVSISPNTPTGCT